MRFPRPRPRPRSSGGAWASHVSVGGEAGAKPLELEPAAGDGARVSRAARRTVSELPPAQTLRVPALSEPSCALRGDADRALRTIFAHVPARYRMCNLALSYSTARDGAALSSLYHAGHVACAQQKGRPNPMLLITRDTEGAVFGAYVASGVWDHRGGYFGGGEAFVFTVHPELRIYKWSRKNSFFQLAQQSSLAIGGGRSFALSLDDMLERGTSGPCDTFDSPRLSSSENFECVVLEAWTFS